MSKTLAVLGATGNQGSAVVEYVTNDPELSKQWKVRAITRSANSDKSKALKDKKVEVVQGDVTDRASFEKALENAHTLFAMTTPVFGVDDPLEAEFQVIKTIADVAVEQAVAPFDAKAKGEEYIKTLPIKSSFYCPGSFMQNYRGQAMLAPSQDPSQTDTWVIGWNMRPETQMPLIDAVGDGGKWVGAILAEPDKFEGKTVCAATKMYSLTEMAAAFSRSSGKNVIYRQVSTEEFTKSLPGMVAPLFVEYFGYVNDYGYYGPGSQEKVEWAAKQARGRLTTFEEYLEKHPYKLE